MTVSEPSYAPLSADHYARLAAIVSIAHADLREIRPDLSEGDDEVRSRPSASHSR